MAARCSATRQASDQHLRLLVVPAAGRRHPRPRSSLCQCRRPTPDNADPKQASEFGIVAGGEKLAALLLFINDVHSLGLKTAQGLTFTASFYGT